LKLADPDYMLAGEEVHTLADMTGIGSGTLVMRQDAAY
jgi:hypothetical protein